MKIVIDKKERDMFMAMEKALMKTIKFNKPARVDGCDNTLRLTKAWMEEHDIPFARWEDIFRATGGYCDCEVLMNTFHALRVHK